MQILLNNLIYKEKNKIKSNHKLLPISNKINKYLNNKNNNKITNNRKKNKLIKQIKLQIK